MRYHLTLTCSSEISSLWIICTPFSFLLSLVNFESLILRPLQHLSWTPTLSLTVSPSFSRALGDTLRTVFIWLTFWFPYIFLTLPLRNLLFLFLTHNCVDTWENRWPMTPEAFFQLLAQTQGKSVELNFNTVEWESGLLSEYELKDGGWHWRKVGWGGWNFPWRYYWEESSRNERISLAMRRGQTARQDKAMLWREAAGILREEK